LKQREPAGAPSTGKGEAISGQRGGQDADRLRPDPMPGK
jgi:hypothetical protein